MKKIYVILGVAMMVVLSACNGKKTTDVAVSDNTTVVMDNIFARKSVRSYIKDQAIGSDTIQNILRAAMAAPSGMDVRPWSFVVLRDKSNFENLFEGNMNLRKFQEAAVVIVVCADTTMAKRGTYDGSRVPNPIWRDDMGACTENLLLAVEAYGLGAVWRKSRPCLNCQPKLCHIAWFLSDTTTALPSPKTNGTNTVCTTSVGNLVVLNEKKRVIYLTRFFSFCIYPMPFKRIFI